MTTKTYTKYMTDVEREYTPLTAEEETKLINDYQQNGDRKAYNKLILSQLKYVVKVAHHYKNQGVPLEDLIQEGNLYLDRAIKDFDPSKGFRFNTYARNWIRSGMGELLASQSRFVRVTGTEGTRKSNVNKTISKLEQKLFRKPTVEEISIETGLPMEELVVMETLEPQASIYSKNQNGDILLDFIKSPDTPNIEQSEVKEKVLNFINSSSLDKRMKTIIKLYYGFEHGDKKTLEEISSIIDSTRERVRQLKEEALIMIRKINKIKETSNQLHLTPDMIGA